MWLWNGLRSMVWDSGENNETQQAEAAAETRQSAAEKMRASRAAFLRKLDDAKKPAKATANASNDSGPAAKKSRKDTKLPEASAASAVTAKPRTITSIVAASNASDNLVSDNDRHTVSPKQDETISTPKSNITEIRPNKNKLDSGEKKAKGTLVASGKATLKSSAKASKSVVASPAEHATPSSAKPVESAKIPKSAQAPDRAKTTSEKVSAKIEKPLESGKNPKSVGGKSKKISAKSPEQLKIALHRSLCRVFQLTLDANAVDSSPDTFVVKDTDASEYFTPADMSQASFECIFARYDMRGPQARSRRAACLKYLYGCYVRVQEERLNAVFAPHYAEMNNLVITQTTTVLLDLSEMDGEVLMDLEAASQVASSYYVQFEKQLISHIAREDRLKNFGEPILTDLMTRVSKGEIGNSADGALCSLSNICSNNKKIAAMLALQSAFLPADAANGVVRAYSGHHMEQQTTLGVVLRISLLKNQQMLQDKFGDLSGLRLHLLGQRQTEIRRQMEYTQTWQHRLILALLKSDPEAREQVLLWITRTLQFNEKRENMNAPGVASEGFFLNLSVVLLLLAQPFVKGKDAKTISQISVKYLDNASMVFPEGVIRVCQHDAFMVASDPSVPKEEETIPEEDLDAMYDDDDNLDDMYDDDDDAADNADGTDASAAASSAAAASPAATMSDDRKFRGEVRTKEAEASFHFVCRVFFATSRALHLGPLQMINNQYKIMMRTLQHLQAQRNNPQMRPRYNDALSRLCILDTVLWEPRMVRLTLQFIALELRWVHSVAKNGDTPGQWLPLPDTPCEAYARIPEHILENAFDYLELLAKVEPYQRQHALDDTFGDELTTVLNFIVTFLQHPNYIHSPHLRGKMGEVMHHVFLPPSNRGMKTPDRFYHRLLSRHELASKFLAMGLVKLYGAVEATGFYEKTTLRFNIAQVLKYIFALPTHEAAFLLLTSDQDVFPKFAHGIINEISSSVTDAIIKLQEIRETQLKMADIQAWTQLEESVRTERENAHRESERAARGYLQLANETIHMIFYLTQNDRMKEVFVMPKLVDRFASMLAGNLFNLAGPKGINLKVENPASYNFNPKKMLKETMLTCLHFNKNKTFIDYMARGFYDAKAFRKARKIASRQQILEESELQLFDALIKDLDESAAAAKQEDEALDDIPDEFLDSLVYVLMKDPILLPSGNNVDRVTILQHLMNTQTDPFSRKPLTEAELVPNTELRDRINKWLADRKAAKAANSDPHEPSTDT